MKDKIGLNIKEAFKTDNLVLKVIVSLIALSFAIMILNIPVIRICLMVAFLLVSIIAIFIWPYIGIIGIVICYFFFGHKAWYAAGTGFLHPIFVISGVTLLFWLINILMNKNFHFIKSSVHLALLGLTAAMFASTHFAVFSPKISWHWNVLFLKAVIIYFLISNLVSSFKKFNIFFWAIAGCIIIQSLRGIRIWHSLGYGRLECVIGGEIIDSNAMAMVLLTVMPFLVHKIFSKNKIERLLAIIGLPAILLCITINNSRGSTLGLILMCLIIVLRSLKNPKIILSLIGVLTVITLVAPSEFLERFETTFSKSEERDGSAQTRIIIWKIGIRMWKDYPVIGVGQENFPYLTSRYHSKVHLRDAHNNFVKVAAETGTIGLFFYLLLIFLALKELWLIRRHCPEEFQGFRFKDMAVSLEASILGTLLAGCFCTTLYHSFVYWFFALTVALKHLAKANGLLEKDR